MTIKYTRENLTGWEMLLVQRAVEEKIERLQAPGSDHGRELLAKLSIAGLLVIETRDTTSGE